jgi:tetratricopeptide (TPR) repeat protein
VREEASISQLVDEGRRLFKERRFLEALAVLDQALAYDPDSAAAWSLKGLVLEYLHRYEEALRCCEQAIQLDSTHADAYAGKSLALIGLKRYEEALTTAECAGALTLTMWGCM